VFNGATEGRTTISDQREIVATSLDFTVCFVTSRTDRQESTDVLVSPNAANGLKKQSLIRTNKIATLDTILANELLGKFVKKEMFTINNNLKLLLKLEYQKYTDVLYKYTLAIYGAFLQV
jgi:mRNA interferase MazF